MIIPFFGFCKIAKKIVGVLGQIAHTTQHLIPHMIGHQKSQHHPTISTNSFIIKRLYQRLKKNLKSKWVSVFLCVSLLCLHVALLCCPSCLYLYQFDLFHSCYHHYSYSFIRLSFLMHLSHLLFWHISPYQINYLRLTKRNSNK